MPVNSIYDSLNKLKEYCRDQDFKGWDPYDGLNSKVFRALPFRNNKIIRLFWIQFFKHSPINLRALFFIPKEYNPKALALFLSGYVNIYKAFGREEDKEVLNYLINKLVDMRSKEYDEICWGYNFDWQSRAFFIPKFTPNIIVSTFAGNALLDVYELTGDKKYLKDALSVCEFILKKLNKSYDNKGNFCFSYSPIDVSKIFNASLLASKFLSRVYSFNNSSLLKDNAKKSIEFCCKRQNSDGSWFYGSEDNQRWVDGFHTGYNLEAIYEYQKYTGDESYSSNFKRGLDFYLSKFFTKDGISKYYAESIYPIDVHSSAQLIVLLSKTGLLGEKIDLAKKVLNWAISNMQSEKGHFFYQAIRYYKIRIPYMRWSQAWMLYALSHLAAKGELWEK